MEKHPVERYIRDIKVSGTVALAFVIALLLLFFANTKFQFADKLVAYFIR